MWVTTKGRLESAAFKMSADPTKSSEREEEKGDLRNKAPSNKLKDGKGSDWFLFIYLFLGVKRVLHYNLENKALMVQVASLYRISTHLKLKFFNCFPSNF